jgi:hypothetical protein
MTGGKGCLCKSSLSRRCLRDHGTFLPPSRGLHRRVTYCGNDGNNYENNDGGAYYPCDRYKGYQNGPNELSCSCTNTLPLTEIPPELFLKKLIGKSDVEYALKRLDKLTQEEARMAAAQILKATRTVDDRVGAVDEQVAGVHDRVASVDERVKVIDERVKAVDGRVKVVNDKVAEVIHGAQLPLPHQ